MDLPPDLSGVTCEWLTEVLARSGALQGVVTAVRQGPMAGGIAVTSSVGRFLLDVDGSGPASVVVKVTNPIWTSTYGTGLYQREVRFYRELAKGGTLPVPRCFHAELGDDQTFALVLEDLSEADPGHRLDGLTGRDAERVLDTLADLHRTWWGSDTLAGWPRKTHTREDAQRLFDVFVERWPRLLAQGKFAVTPELSDAVERFTPEAFVAGLRLLADGANTLIHSDLHAENLLLDGDRVVFIDWQNAAVGHPAFDLIQVLGAIRPEVLASELDRLIDRYRARLDRLDPADLTASLRAAAQWMFIGVVGWLVVFEEESLRDAATVQAHWERLAPLLLLLG